MSRKGTHRCLLTCLSLHRIHHHGEFTHILLRLEEDNVHLWREETDERYAGTQANGHTERCNLNLNKTTHVVPIMVMSSPQCTQMAVLLMFKQ